jgi:hypothetical protein
MEAVIAVVLIVAMVGGVSAWVVLDSRTRTRTNASLREEAAAHGWNLVDRDDTAFAPFTGVPFGKGSSQRAEDVVRSAGGEVTSFTYRWFTGAGGNKNGHTRRVTVLRAGPTLPRLEVEPGTMIAKANALAHGSEMNLELVDFEKAWSVRATDDRVGHAVMHPRMMERFMSQDLWARSVFFEAGLVGIVDMIVQRPHVVTHTVDTLAVLREIEELIPDFLRADYP